MATRLVLIRHGQGRVNLAQKWAGLVGCAGLTDLGRRQVAALAAHWKGTGTRPDALLTSPVQRARETADLLAAELGGLSVTMDCALCELHFGAADGLTWQEHAERYGAFDLLREPSRQFAPGGESWADVRQRVRTFLQACAARYAGRSVAMVTHAGFIVASVLEFGRDSTVDGAALDPEFTSLTQWDVLDGRWTLVSLASVGARRIGGHALDPGSEARLPGGLIGQEGS